MVVIFLISISIIIYSYLGYPLILFVLNLFKSLLARKKHVKDNHFEPEVTLFISAYNESGFVHKKVENSLLLDYPKNKLKHLWITDGSDDGTQDLLKKYNDIDSYHENERMGKTGAINRGIQFVKSPIVIFSDANTLLNREAIKEIVSLFKNPKVGCVAGEKRIIQKKHDNAVNTGEGLYWKYESFIKENESNLNSAIGAVGELFAIRTELFRPLEPDTILDDFILSLRIALQGFEIKYAPKAYASERASLNIKEELKRKVRIAYGGFQSANRLKQLLKFWKYPLLSFQYISHKILRWYFVPVSFIIAFVSNSILAYNKNWQGIYTSLFYLQILFYVFVLLGYIFQSKRIKIKLLFTPYYLFMMNLSELIGFIRFVRKKQSVNWERSKREQ